MAYFTPDGADYWIEDKDTHAFFGGKLAGELGLGAFDVQKLHGLLLGIDPRTLTVDLQTGQLLGKQLTPGKKESKRAGYEVTVDGPKDLGVLMALGMDERIVPEVLERAGRDVMGLIERDAQTRVRIGKQDTDRATGSIVYAGVLHTTARPEGGKVDVQPHYHFLVANATYDPVEKRYKALQLQPFAGNGAKEARPYYMAYFNARLAQYMQELGYQTERAGDSFRVVGIPDRVRQEFSQRRARIKATAAELEGKIKEKYGPEAKLSRQGFQKLAMTTREPKQPGQTWNSLLDHWNSRVTEGERQAVLDTVIASHREPAAPELANRAALDWAVEHAFERSSVVSERELLTHALRRGIGSVTAEGILSEIGKHPGLIRREIGGRSLVTSKEVLAEEKGIAEFGEKGRGRLRPLSSPSLSPGETGLRTLSASQQAAVRHVWESTDRVIMIRGAAGTGKTTLTRVAVAGIEKPVVMLAPSAEASRGVLRRDGFEQADTLARFLVDKDFQAKAKDGVIWLDEASLAGARDVAKLVRLADSLNARLVLSGDRRQHKSVAHGDVLRLLEDKVGLPVAEVSDIKRQKGEYLKVAELLSKGQMEEAVAKLDRMGWVKEGGLVEDYLGTLKEGKSALVVVPTHAEGDRVQADIRTQLKADGTLTDEREVRRLVPLHLTRAELADAKKNPEQGVLYTRDGAFREERQALAVGDRIRATSTLRDAAGRRIDNGSVMELTGWTDGGNMRVRVGDGMDRILDGDVGHIAPAYVSTSQGGQGKTVDRMYLWMPAVTFPAVRMDTAYTSGTRGRERLTVYTDDKQALLHAIKREDTRMLATDMVKLPKRKLRVRLKRRVALLRDLGNHLGSKMRDMLKVQDRELTRG